MNRLRHSLLLLVAALAVMLGVGHPAAAASASARVSSIDAPSSPATLRAGLGKAAPTPNADGGEQPADGPAPEVIELAAASAAIADAVAGYDLRFVAPDYVGALPRGPPAFVC